jgi:hypothetical protein
MTTYRIKITYETGNSFGSHIEEDYLNYVWINLEIAKENLQSIKQHYLYYKKRNSGWGAYRLTDEQKNEIIDSHKKYSWFSVHDFDKFSDFYLSLKLDENFYRDFEVFWAGYFEKLQEIEIVFDGDNDLKITF